MGVHRVKRGDLSKVINRQPARGFACKPKSFVTVVVPDVPELALLVRASNGDPLFAEVLHKSVDRFGGQRETS